MITVIAPHARPQFAANLLTNFRRQVGLHCQLIVVENGDASSPWPADVTVLRSGPHQSTAMNAGLAWLRTHGGGGAWARMDDDDYYGPDYLLSTSLELQCHPVVGKTWGFVLFDDGLFRFAGIESAPATNLTGGSLAATSPFLPAFSLAPDDDIRWCRELQASGVPLWASTHRHYCYDRRSARHGAPRVITTGPLTTRWAFGAAEFHGLVAPSYVDAPAAPLRLVPPPSDDELVAELSGS